jgi:predicted amidohydrolase YtcJ
MAAGVCAAWAYEDDADLILINGRILTVDPQDAIAQAVAVRGGRIAARSGNQASA